MKVRRIRYAFSIASFCLLLPAFSNPPQDTYPAQDIRIASDSLVTLAGALRLPKRSEGERVPAVLLLGGGGPSPKGIYPMLEERLLASGIATFSYDKRGIGQSTGTFLDTMELMQRDAAAALADLRMRPGIDAKRVAVLGLSQGGVIGPALAANDPDVAAVVMLAAPAGKQGTIFLDGLRDKLAASGMRDTAIAATLAAARRYMDAQTDAKSRPDIPGRAKTLETAFTAGGWTHEQAVGAVRTLSDPVLVSMYRVAADTTLGRVRAPVLALYAGDDAVVPTPRTLPEARAALRDHADATIIEVPNVNHGFKPRVAQSSGKLEYVGWPVSDPRTIDLISRWLDDRLHANQPGKRAKNGHR